MPGGGSKPGERRGGRPKGVKNKRLMADSLRAKIDAEYPGYDPLVALAHLAHRKDAPMDQQERCHKTLAEYYWPKRKPVDESGDSREQIHLHFPASVAKL